MTKSGSKPSWPGLGPFDRGSDDLRRSWQQEPRNRSLDEMGFGPFSRGREPVGLLKKCAKCGAQYTFPQVVDEGQGEIERRCPKCGAVLDKINRKQWEAARERWERRKARMFKRPPGLPADAAAGPAAPDQGEVDQSSEEKDTGDPPDTDL